MFCFTEYCRRKYLNFCNFCIIQRFPNKLKWIYEETQCIVLFFFVMSFCVKFSLSGNLEMKSMLVSCLDKVTTKFITFSCWPPSKNRCHTSATTGWTPTFVWKIFHKNITHQNYYSTVVACVTNEHVRGLWRGSRSQMFNSATHHWSSKALTSATHLWRRMGAAYGDFSHLRNELLTCEAIAIGRCVGSSKNSLQYSGMHRLQCRGIVPVTNCSIVKFSGMSSNWVICLRMMK